MDNVVDGLGIALVRPSVRLSVSNYFRLKIVVRKTKACFSPQKNILVVNLFLSIFRSLIYTWKSLGYVTASFNI